MAQEVQVTFLILELEIPMIRCQPAIDDGADLDPAFAEFKARGVSSPR